MHICHISARQIRKRSALLIDVDEVHKRFHGCHIAFLFAWCISTFCVPGPGLKMHDERIQKRASLYQRDRPVVLHSLCIFTAASAGASIRCQDYVQGIAHYRRVDHPCLWCRSIGTAGCSGRRYAGRGGQAGSGLLQVIPHNTCDRRQWGLSAPFLQVLARRCIHSPKEGHADDGLTRSLYYDAGRVKPRKTAAIKEHRCHKAQARKATFRDLKTCASGAGRSFSLDRRSSLRCEDWASTG